MRQGIVYNNEIVAGKITETINREFIFRYSDDYFIDTTKPAISLTIPKSTQEHHSKNLFPFFFNMLSEGVNKMIQCRKLGIDEKDYFGLLLKTGGDETIGAIRVVEI
jgi:serine/threonine-protein kinase HipA